MTTTVTYHLGDVFKRLAEIPDGSIDLIVTSPPFLALRSYLPADHPDKGKEIGSEATPADFLATLCALTAEWRRVLAPHGSLCVELGDTYSGSGGAGGDYGEDGMREGQEKFDGSATRLRTRKRTDGGQYGNHPQGGTKYNTDERPVKGSAGWPLDKSLCLLPTLYPASLAYGRNLLDPTAEPFAPWRIRNLIVWHRPNPPVGALGDKVRPSTSYVTVACTSRTRWFDLDAERTEPKDFGPRYSTTERDAPGQTIQRFNKLNEDGERIQGNPAGAPPLDCWLDATTDDVWTLSTQPYRGAHYATFPVTLPRKLINLMCPRQVCVECGEPRRRIVDTDRVEPSGKSGKDVVHRTGGSWAARLETTTTTLGWTDCGHSDADNHTYDDEYPNIAAAQRAQVVNHGKNWRRGRVLDPFAGSGTTLLAAAETGRDSIGIDLDIRNLDLARQRIGEQMLVVGECVDGSAVVWTVDAMLPGTKGEAEGQQSLFA